MGELKVNRVQSVIYLLKQLKPYRMKMIGSILFGILKEVSIIAAAGICAYLAALAVEGRSLGGGRWLILLCVCAAARGISTYMESYLSHDVAYRALVDYRVKLYEKFITLCPDILLKNRSGQVATTLMNDVEQLEWFYGHTVGVVVIVGIVCATVVGFLGRLHWSLGAAAVVCMCVILSVPFIMREKADAQGVEARHRLGEANSVTLEGINGMNEILTLNWWSRYQEKNRQYMERLTEIQVEYAKRMGTEGGLLQMSAGISAVCINILAVWLTLHGFLAVEWYAVVGTTIWLAFNPLLEICSLARTFGTVFAASRRVTALLTSEPVVQDTGSETDVSKLEGEISFTHVWFRYGENAPDVLQDISFQIRSGEVVALVGESGAGKTTCTSLLSRLWDVRDGSICVGGVDIRSMKLGNLHEMIAVVLQDVYLFNTTILENIRLGRPDANEEQVIEAAKRARAHEFISSLPQGYHTETGERGVQLSGGQRQRIAIARALLGDSPILVLDEAVSSLDTKTDMEIQETIRNLAHRKTILMVAHRMSTILEADRVIVLHNGKVVQQGKHEELLKKDGYYRKLICAQLDVQE